MGWVVGEWRNKTKLQPSSVWLELELSLAISWFRLLIGAKMVVAYIVVWLVLPIIEPYWVLATMPISVRGFSKLCLILVRIPWEL